MTKKKYTPPPSPYCPVGLTREEDWGHMNKRWSHYSPTPYSSKVKKKKITIFYIMLMKGTKRGARRVNRKRRKNTKRKGISDKKK
jgi:hypothetical protein